MTSRPSMLRHEDIDEDQIHLLMLQEPQAVFSIFGGQDTVPRPFERASGRPSALILRHQ